MRRAQLSVALVSRVLVAVLVTGLAGAQVYAAEEPKAPAEPAPPATKPAADPATKPAAAPAALPRPVEQYDLKLRDLEERVVDLKEKIFRTKSRLLLLKERVVNDVIAEAKIVVNHHNDMGSSFKATKVLYELDGEKIYYQDDTSDVLQQSDPIELFAGNVLPGNHVLKVEMVYRGDSSVFSYLNGYQFRLRASYTFYATKGKITTVTAIGYQKGDITWDLTKRPSIKFRVSQVGYTKDKVGDTGAPAEEQ